MFKEKPEPTPAQIQRAEELEKSAEFRRQKSIESFERSDTDGFLTQWAHDMGADKDRENAKILRNGGCATFPVLCDKDGNVLAHKIYTFANKHAGYGVVKRWRIPDDKISVYGRKWVPVGSTSRVQKQLELREEMWWFPAVAKIGVPEGAKNTGLGGCANAHVRTIKKEDA